MNDPLSFLNQKSYGTYNRKLAKEYGVIIAVIISELVEKRNYHMDREELISDERHGDGWFYHTIESLEGRTGIHRREQETALRKIEGAGLIEIKIFGVPAKRHFRLCEKNILDFFNLSKKHSSLDDRTNWNGHSNNTDCTNVQTAHIYKEPKEEHKEDIASSQEKESTHTISKKSIRAKKTDISFNKEKWEYENITPEEKEIWKRIYPSIDLDRELLASIQWLKGNPSKANKRNWRRFLEGWLSRAEEKIANKAAYASIAPPKSNEVLNREWTRKMYSEHAALHKKIEVKYAFVSFKGTSRELYFANHPPKQFEELFVQMARGKQE